VDFEPSAGEQELTDEFRRFLENECSIAVVRTAEQRGFRPDLWKRIVEFGIPALYVPLEGEEVTSLLQLVLLAELCGRYLVPAPVLESLAAARGLGSTPAQVETSRKALGDDRFESIVHGDSLVTVALWPIDTHPVQILPVGALAGAAVAVSGGELVLAEPADVHSYDDTHGATPIARWDFGKSPVCVPLGGNIDDVMISFRLLTAGALVGIAQRALEIGAEYATQRRAFGTPIGTFQGVAHPLADSATAIAGALLLARKAAWCQDVGRSDEALKLSRLALGFCAETSMTTTTRALHVHGGYGSALEYDVHLFHQRARALATIGGDPRSEFTRVGRQLLDHTGEVS
jgi:alkylation response protein AidB-like acyl-CoA dehydrogenase